MALWDENSIKDINEGTTENDGTGDSIRDAFNKVDLNFANISNFLASPTVGFLNATITTNLTSNNYATFANTFTANATGTTASFTGNTTTGNLIANTGLYSSGNTHLRGNTFISGNIIPTAGGLYDLGTAANPFGTIYYTSAVTGGTVQTTDAGQLVIHANTTPGDVKDVGILGNISHHYSTNTYAYFGYQYQTNNFVYKITNVNPTTGNSVVYSGIYGNTQFGSQFLSNTTTSTSTSTGALIVSGGTGVAGNLNVGGVTNIGGNTAVTGNITATGNVYANGYLALTADTIGYYGTALSGGIVTGSARYTSAEASTSATTGAIAVLTGGVGVNGNIYSGGGFYGNITGNILSNAQPYITTLGSLNGLTISSGYSISTPDLQATTIGATNITAGTLNITGTFTGLTSLTLSGNVTSNTAGFVGSLYGTVQTAAQTRITSLGALTSLAVDGATRLGITVANSFSTANAVISGGYVNGLANISATQATVTNFATSNAVVSGGYISGLANISATNASSTTQVATNFSTGNAQITGGTISGLTNLGATTAVATNFSTGNAQITSGTISGLTNLSSTTEVATNFSSGNVRITGGYINSVANIYATTGVVTNFSTGNAVITGGYVNGLANVTATQATVTNFGTANAVITGGYISGLANVAATNAYVGTLTASTVNASTIGNTGATLTGTIQTAAQTNITSVGTLSALSVSATANVGITTTANLLLTTTTGASGGVFVTGNILPSANLTYNIGSSTQWFNTFYGKSTQAQYADLAEKYLADADYEVGTVVAVGGAAEVTASKWGDLAIGVVSNNPAYMMNAGLEGGTYIALKGRVPVKVIGAIIKGQRLIAGDNGCAVAAVPHANDVFGVALESNSEVGVKLIEAVIL